MLEKNKKLKNGFVALISILIIGAVVLVISIGLSLRSISETDMSLSQQQANNALSLANLCAEQALMKLESVLNYSGSETLNIDGNSCSILAITGSGNTNRIVTTQSAVGGYTRKVKVVVSQISPIMQISSWNEVADLP